MSKPGIDQLLAATALDGALRRRLEQNPDQIFDEYDLTEAQRDMLRHPDHRLLRLFAEVLARQSTTLPPTPPAPQPHAILAGRSLPEVAMVLTVVPCAQVENGEVSRFSYAVWVNPLPEGADPATLPPPAGAALPGQPLAPLHAVVQLSAVQAQLPSGEAPVGLWASLRQSTNTVTPPPREASGNPAVPPFGSDLASPFVEEAASAVRRATPEERYHRILDLLRTLQNGEAR